MTLAELNLTIYQSEEGVVFTDSYVQTRVVFGATLTNNDITACSVLTTKDLYAKSFAF